ncbi:hypothetical protein OIU77_027809 [Salix suchowensis]|uniref:Protein kinase domain-containing protein n=1 Tax=Salix suchowensis TaxID=1278906 RepID=A0ABQ9BQY0_9ROSI|nr:hypothetical protein OIU77_027809 [Salix suchowensis]
MEPRVGNKFCLGRKIGSGSSGDIYLGTSIQTNEEVAIKLENVKTKHPQLLYECKLYKTLQGGTGIPNVKWFGVEGDYYVLVMDLLGPSVEDLFKFCDRKLSLKSVLMLADQMINRVKFVHSKSFLHRDINPDNFLMGLGRLANQVYAIDFGLAKKYRDTSTHQHIPYRENKNPTGTARYASMNTHLGIEQSRRDDLESLGYVLMYLLSGSLPWQGLKAGTKKQRYEKISEKKVSTSIEVLCRGYPTEFASYFHYCRSLRFDDTPDYAYLKRLFRDLFIREGFQFDYVFDWTILKYQQSQIANPPTRTPVLSNSNFLPPSGSWWQSMSSSGSSATLGNASDPYPPHATDLYSSNFLPPSGYWWQSMSSSGSGAPHGNASGPSPHATDLYSSIFLSPSGSWWQSMSSSGSGAPHGNASYPSPPPATYLYSSIFLSPSGSWWQSMSSSGSGAPHGNASYPSPPPATYLYNSNFLPPSGYWWQSMSSSGSGAPHENASGPSPPHATDLSSSNVLPPSGSSRQSMSSSGSGAPHGIASDPSPPHATDLSSSNVLPPSGSSRQSMSSSGSGAPYGIASDPSPPHATDLSSSNVLPPSGSSRQSMSSSGSGAPHGNASDPSPPHGHLMIFPFVSLLLFTLLLGFQFDYVFDWTISKYQQSQIANPPTRALVGPGAGPSLGIPPRGANNFDRKSGGEEVTPGWSSTDHARRRNSGPIVNFGNPSKQKGPVANDPSLSKDATCAMEVIYYLKCSRPSPWECF